MASAASIQYVQKMFIAYFGRPAAPTGQEYYATLVDQGRTAALADDFWNSAESQSYYGGLTTEGRVNAIFQQLFGRDANLSGLTYWTTEINAGRVSLPTAALTILNSAAAADLTAFNAKLSVATAFTGALDTAAEVLSYQSNTDGGRSLLSTITTEAQALAAVANIDTLVADVVAGGTTNPGQTFTLTTSTSLSDLGTNELTSVNEGQTVYALLQTTNVPAGTKYSYAISGINSADLIGGGVLTGQVEIDSQGRAILSLPLRGDQTTEGLENVTIAFGTPGSTTSTSFSVVDTSRNPDSAPTFTSDTRTVNAAENQTSVATVAATDADGDAITYSITGGADAALFTINASTGALTFVSGPNFEAPASGSGTNAYDVQVTATANGKTATQQLTVNVTNVNEAPTLTLSSTVTVDENTTAVAAGTVTDPDASDTVAYSLSGVDAAQFQVSTAGVLSFVSAPDFETPNDNGADNVYNVTVTATDSGGRTSAQAVAITIRDVGEPITRVLTVGTETVAGGSGNDLFDGRTNNDSVNTGDSLTGGAGTDTLAVDYTAAAGTVFRPTLSGIEVIDVTDTNGVVLDLANTDADITTLRSTQSLGTITFDNVGDATAAVEGVLLAGGAGITLNYTDSALAGTSDNISISIDNVAGPAPITIARAAGSTLGAAETVTLTSSVGAANAVTVTNNTTTAGSLVLAGSAALTVTNGGGFSSISASGRTVAVNVTGAATAETITGGTGNDTITAGGGIDVLDGGDGDDQFLYAASADLIGATAGADAAIDSVVGGNGADRVSVAGALAIGAAGADTLARITGVETLIQTAGGASTVVLASDAALSDFRTINVSAATAASTITLTGVTVGVSVTGSNAAASADIITGGAGNDTLSGGLGQNTIAGGAGDDRITMGANAEDIDGGAGNDTIVGGANVTDNDTIAGGAGSDTLTLAASTTLTVANRISGIEVLTLASEGDTAGANTGYQYVLAMDDQNDTDAAASTTDVMTINASGLLADVDADTAGNQAETLNFTGSGTTTHLYSVTGGAGADTLVGGNLADTLLGGAGADQLTGGAGTDSLDGGEGGDTYTYADTHFVAADVIADTGTTGTDTVAITSTTAITDAMFANKTGLEAATLSSAVSYTLGTNAQASGITAVTMGAAGTLAASAYTVALTVTESAGVNNATITTGSGNDSVTLADGVDSVTLGAGDDTVVGGANVSNADTLTGGTGTDVLILNSGATAGNVQATTIDWTGTTTFSGFEQITVSAGLAATAVAGATNDTAGSVNDYNLTLDDTNVAAASTFTVDASALRTTITTALGVDLEIGGGDDTTTGEENLSLDASGLTGTRAVSVLGGAGVDTIQGGAAADTINGNGGADSLVGNGGDDVISGGDGNDTITGSAGADNITLGNGADVVILDAIANSTGSAFDTVTDFVTGTDELNITLAPTAVGAGVQTIDVSGFASVANFSDGLVSLGGTAGAAVFGDSFYSVADGRLHIDANGDGQINQNNDYSISIGTVAAGDLNFNITGTANADAITGGAGADTIDGGADDDTITGGAGADAINVGAGADTFVFAATQALNGTDVITDFTSGASGDILDFSGVVSAVNGSTGAADGFGVFDYVLGGVTGGDIVLTDGGVYAINENGDQVLVVGDIVAVGSETLNQDIVVGDGVTAYLIVGTALGDQSLTVYRVYDSNAGAGITAAIETIATITLTGVTDLDALVAANIS